MNVFRFAPVETPSLIRAAPAARASGFESLTLSYGSNIFTDSAYFRPGLSRNRAAHKFEFVRLLARAICSLTGGMSDQELKTCATLCSFRTEKYSGCRKFLFLISAPYGQPAGSWLRNLSRSATKSRPCW